MANLEMPYSGVRYYEFMIMIVQQEQTQCYTRDLFSHI